MPNHVANILTIEGPLPEVKKIFKEISPGPTEEELKTPYEESGEDVFKPASPVEFAKRREGTYEIDFGKIVPGRPGNDEGWYDWSIANWGTKWNAYDMEKIDDYSMRFSTAWSMPEPVIQALSKMFPDVVVKIRWADEDIGHNCGEAHFKGGDVIYDDIPEGGSKEAYEMAFDIQGCAEDYVYDEDQGTYVYNDNESRLGIGPVVHDLRERFAKLVEDR